MDFGIVEQIEQLIGDYKNFVKSGNISGSSWKSDFAGWLINQNNSNAESEHNGMGQEEIFIGMMLVSLSNLTRTRVNKLISGSPFSTIMDYQFLLFLVQHGKQKKSELIAANYMEMSSGIEVIKRLMKHNWINEEHNPDDKRSKLVVVSAAGEAIVEKYTDEMEKLYSSFSDGLHQSQKKSVVHSLHMLTEKI